MEITNNNFSIFFIIQITKTKESCIEFLKTNGILSESFICNFCNEEMKIYQNKNRVDQYIFKCKRCNKAKSIRNGSFLEKSKLSLETFVFLIYFWSTKASTSQLCIHLNLSKKTICEWTNFIREVCSWKLMQLDQKIGGIGKVIQVDESLIYKAKYWIGHALSSRQKWIVGFYDLENKIGFSRFIENRTFETLLRMIESHIYPGSIIHTDCWSGYNGISTINVNPPFIHQTVNHSQNFVDPNTGCHTNNVEAYWGSLKLKFKKIKGVNYNQTSSYVDEHEYIERYGKTSRELFYNILMHISEKYIFE